MHKYISAIVLSTLSITAAAHGKWNVGVAGGWGFTNTKETLIQIVPSAPSRDGYKYTLKQNGPTIGVTGGYTLFHNQNTFGLSVGGYKDLYTGRNSGSKTDFISGVQSDFTKDLKRKYTLELAGKIGRKLNSELHLYGKFSVLYSQFKELYGDTASGARKNLRGRGVGAGLGLQKAYESFNLGVEYDYQYYGRIGSKMDFTASGNAVQNQSKIRPQYHNIFITISKSF
jgi:hypothetical protein